MYEPKSFLEGLGMLLIACSAMGALVALCYFANQAIDWVSERNYDCGYFRKAINAHENRLMKLEKDLEQRRSVDKTSPPGTMG